MGKFDKLAVTGTVVPSAKKVAAGKDRLMHGHGRRMPSKGRVPRDQGWVTNTRKTLNPPLEPSFPRRAERWREGKVSTRGAIQIRPAISEIRLRIFAVMARPSSMSAIAQSVNSPWNLNNSERKFCEFLPRRGMILIKLSWKRWSICWLIPRRFWDFSLVFVDLVDLVKMAVDCEGEVL